MRGRRFSSLEELYTDCTRAIRHTNKSVVLQGKYLGSNKHMYEILVTGPLGTSECAGECRFSANLCKHALDVTADVIVEATRNADILTINANAL